MPPAALTTPATPARASGRDLQQPACTAQHQATCRSCARHGRPTAGGRWQPASLVVARRRRGAVVVAAVSGEDDAPPALLGDWREFRAKLVADEGVGRGWAARQAQQNLALLQAQNRRLAAEETWAHATGAPEVGGLLLATAQAPELLGEEYWQAVVFILRHDVQGSLGLILNRPTPLHMGRGRGGLPLAVNGMEGDLRDAFAASTLYCGGFKAQQVITLLHGHARLAGSMEVVPGVYIGGQHAAVGEVVTGGLPQSDFRFFAGCCSWPPGGLEREVAAGGWQPAACSRTLVLKQCLQLPVPLWREAMCLLGGEFAETARRQQRADAGSDSDD